MGLTLAVLGTERSLADWGIDTSSASLVLHTWQADEFTFSIPVASAFAARRFAYNTPITLQLDGTRIFIGKIRRRPWSANTAERHKYVAKNFWDDLESLIYEQQRAIVDEAFESLGLVATTQVVFGRDTATGIKMNTDAQMLALLTFAVIKGIGLGMDFVFTGLTAPWEQANDVSVASGLRREAAWQPDLLARTEYGSGVPVFRLRRPIGMTPVNVDVTAVDSIISLELDLRDDMVPAGVVFNFLTSEIKPSTGERWQRVTTQTGGPVLDGPGVIKCTLPIAETETVPPSLAANYYAALSTVFLEGTLTLRAREISTAIKPGDLLNFVHGAPEWSGALAPVTEVVHDLGTGVTRVSFGAPTFLAASTFAALAARPKDKPPLPPVPTDAGDPSNPGDPGRGNADTGKTGGGGGPASTGTVPITHCSGGEQVTDNVQRG